MIALLLTMSAIVLAVLLPCLLIGRYLEWRAWDTDRRIARLRTRREGP